MDKNRVSALNALVFAVGLILGLLGYVGDVYSSSVATILMLGVWLVAGAIVRLLASSTRTSAPTREKEMTGRR